MKKVYTLVFAFLMTLSTLPILAPSVEASVYDYSITDITQSAPDTIVVSAQCLFCWACNPNDVGSSNHGDGCTPFACGYPPASFPSYVPCQHSSPNGRYAAIRLTGSFGSVTQKLVCDQYNWPLNTLWSHNFIFSALNFEAGETITIEADFYCSYCYHWYAIPRKFVPDPYTLVFVPLNWEGDLSKDGFFYTSFETYAQTHGDFAIQEVGELTADNTKIVKVKQNLNLDFDKNDLDNFGDTQWNAIIDHAKTNKATGDVYIALTNEGLWGGVAGVTRELYGNVIVVDSDGLGNTETTAHELGHSWGMIEEYNYRSWLAEKPAVRNGYDFNDYPTSDDPNMPYPPPDYDDVRCPGKSFDGEHCIMGPAGHWYSRRYNLGPIPIDVPQYFGGSKGFCPDCFSAIDENIGKVWGSSSGSLAAITVTFFRNGSLPRLDQVEGVPFPGKFMYSDQSGNYSIQVQSGTGELLYSSNVTCNFVVNLPSKLENSTEMPLEVDTRSVLWFAPAFSEGMVIINIKDNEANEIVAAEEVRIAPVGKAWIDRQTTDKDNYSFSDLIEVNTEVNTTEANMNVLVDATLFDPNGVVQDYRSWTGTIFPIPDPLTFHLTVPNDGEAGTWKVYVVVLNSTGQFQDSKVNLIAVGGDTTRPVTNLTIGFPQYMETGSNKYVNSSTSFTLTASDDPSGTGIEATAYRIHNASYDSGWVDYTMPFCLTDLQDGTYNVDYNSTDNAGNVELTNTDAVILDNTVPSVAIVNPPEGWALQDGVHFIISVIDTGSGVSSVSFTIRENDGGEGKPVGFEDLEVEYNATTSKWVLFFNTLQLPDGYYIVIVKARDNLEQAGSTTVRYSIRNWAVLELLPASENNKAGRTMPVKFALRVAVTVDPNQPFVYNEELAIKIYATNNPNSILQTSTFGDGARAYRINVASEKYITNFQTLKTPTQYTVAVYRSNFLIDTFNFRTAK